MRKRAYSDQEHTRDDSEPTEATAPSIGALPNRLLTAFEVAKFLGCHEETVRRAYWRGLLTSQRFGVRGRRVHPADVRRIPFNPNGRLAAVLQRRAALGSDGYVFGSANGEYQPTIQTAWETLKLLANGITPKPGREGMAWNAEQVQRIDLRWHDLRHEGACRLLADGVDIRIIQLMLGHASIQQTQRYRNVTDEELRKDWR